MVSRRQRGAARSGAEPPRTTGPASCAAASDDDERIAERRIQREDDLADVSQDMRLAREEAFGAGVVVIPSTTRRGGQARQRNVNGIAKR